MENEIASDPRTKGKFGTAQYNKIMSPSRQNYKRLPVNEKESSFLSSQFFNYSTNVLTVTQHPHGPLYVIRHGTLEARGSDVDVLMTFMLPAML